MSRLESKKASESAVDNHTYKVFPNDMNSNGTVFGGMIMAVLDKIALVVAERHSERTCVTVCVDSMHFLAPAGNGDILLFSASINKAWNSSMEVGVKVVAENYITRESRHILSAYFTFVAFDDQKVPTHVPAVIPETPAEKRRYEEAEMRRVRRMSETKERQKRKLSP